MIYLTPTIYHRSPRKPIRQWLTSNKSGNISKVGVKIKNIINANSIRMSVRVRLVLNYMRVNQRPKKIQTGTIQRLEIEAFIPDTFANYGVKYDRRLVVRILHTHICSLSLAMARSKQATEKMYFFTLHKLRSTMLFSVQYSVKHSELWQPSWAQNAGFYSRQ